MKNQTSNVYSHAYEMLVEIAEKNGVSDLERYFTSKKKKTMRELFEQLILSAQNRYSTPKTIKFNGENHEKLKEILFDFDPERVLKEYNSESELLERFKKEFRPNKTLSWERWSKSVFDSAKYLAIRFKDADDFNNYVENYRFFDDLPYAICHNISGISFALACDFLKESGFSDFPKPDTHLKEIFSAAGFTKGGDYETFLAIKEMAKEVHETPYKVDKVFWLICSGNFYLDKKDGKALKIKSHKDELIDEIQKIIK